MKWKIYYGDGSTFSDEDGRAEDAPGDNVQVIIDMQPHRMILHGGGEETITEGRRIDPAGRGFYWFEKGHWCIGDFTGLLLYLRRPGLKVTKFGESLVPSSRFHDIMVRASQDPDFPPHPGS